MLAGADPGGVSQPAARTHPQEEGLRRLRTRPAGVRSARGDTASVGGLEPLILDQLPTEGQTVIEKLDSAMNEADFGIVLATPDDEGHRAGHQDENAFRAR